MNKQEFAETLRNIVSNYIEEYNEIGPDAQIAVNPVTQYITVDTGNDIQYDIADSQEAVEEAAAAEDARDADAADYQARQDPDFYALSGFVVRDKNGLLHPDVDAIDRLINTCFP